MIKICHLFRPKRSSMQ